MKCMEARRMVTPYVNRTLTDEEMEVFLDHVEHCSDCMEELDIYFTMYKAMDSLDSGSHQEYNFKKMLQEDIHMAHRSIFKHRLSRGVRFVIVLLAEVLLIMSVFTGYEMKKVHPEQSTIQRAILLLNPRHQGKQMEEELKTQASDKLSITVPDMEDVLAQRLINTHKAENINDTKQTETTPNTESAEE